MVKVSASRSRAYVAAPREDVCLGFANTLYWRGSATPTETLHRARDLLDWAEKEGGADPALARACAGAWESEKEADQAFETALGLRETIYRLFAGVADSGKPPAEEVARLNTGLGMVPARARLTQLGAGAAWQFEASPTVLSLLAPVLWSAGDLLTSARLGQVRACDNPQCRFLFLDDSKAGTRRWCSMSSCGNRAKAHRHYLRHRGDER